MTHTTLRKRKFMRAEQDLGINFSLMEFIFCLSQDILPYFEHGPNVPSLLY